MPAASPGKSSVKTPPMRLIRRYIHASSMRLSSLIRRFDPTHLCVWQDLGVLERRRIRGGFLAALLAGDMVVELPDKHQQLYLREVDQSIIWQFRAARRNKVRFIWVNTLSITSASAVPVVVGAHGPDWLVSALGALTAVLIGVDRLTQFGKLSVEQQAIADALATARRRFTGSLVEGSTDEPFREFVELTERVYEAHHARIEQVRRASAEPIPGSR